MSGVIQDLKEFSSFPLLVKQSTKAKKLFNNYSSYEEGKMIVEVVVSQFSLLIFTFFFIGAKCLMKHDV